MCDMFASGQQARGVVSPYSWPASISMILPRILLSFARKAIAYKSRLLASTGPIELCSPTWLTYRLESLKHILHQAQ